MRGLSALTKAVTLDIPTSQAMGLARQALKFAAKDCRK
jgi:hypothetical protein